MRLNLRKINQLIREAWNKGQAAAVSGRGGKSACYAWSNRVARDYFPDIRSQDVVRIAQGQARLHWDVAKREIMIISTEANVAAPSEENASYQTIAVYEGNAQDPMFDVTGLIKTDDKLCIGDVVPPELVTEGCRYRVTIEEIKEEIP